MEPAKSNATGADLQLSGPQADSTGEHFDFYLKKFQDEGSTSSIPLEMQKKLLTYLKSCASSQRALVQAQTSASPRRPCGIVPPALSKHVLEHYEHQITMLNDSIAKEFKDTPSA